MSIGMSKPRAARGVESRVRVGGMPAHGPGFNRREASGLLLSCALLTVVAAPGYGSTPDCDRASAHLRELRNAIERYQMTHGHFPAQHWWYRTLVADGEIMDTGNGDPWGHPYVYELKGDTFDLLTVGYDGIRGTKDDQVMADRWQWGSCKAARRSGCMFRF